MLKQGIASTTNNLGRLCDTCQSTAATVYCRADSAYLCTTCDFDIHTANPLACRHHRVPFLPIYGDQNQKQHNDNEDEEGEDETASWWLLNPPHNNNNYYHCNQISNNNGVMSGDEYLDLVDYNSCQHDDSEFTSDEYTSVVQEKSYGGDSVVPVQQHKFQLEYHVSNTSGYGYPASIAQTASLSSMDVGLVPESTMSDVSISHPRPHKGTTIDLFSSPSSQVPTQLTPMDRVARVLRYREKKKTRKFEKTIRYASRKAYAETRPRVKGRFAKRTNTQVELDLMFSPALGEIEYGIVPSY